MNVHEEPRYRGRCEAAAYLGVSRRTLRELWHEGQIPDTRVGNRLLVDEQDLDVLVRSLKQSAATMAA